tara:strand:- start:163 stop:876 length:714 start_codon:yes stop_codon:yes gene_type:complete
MFNETHLKELNEISAKFVSQDFVGSSPLSWMMYIKKNLPNIELDKQKFSSDTLNREKLYTMSSNSSLSNLDFSVNVLSWGGMRRTHGVSCLDNFSDWEPLIEKLRSGSINRSEAYLNFSFIRKSGKLKGMGPAFFTKLIFFGHPDHNGFIMDQWTARSINLLLDTQLVKMISQKNGSSSVSDFNNEMVYEKFCISIEDLTLKINNINDPKIIEEIIFSNGGRGEKKGDWRRYLLQQT